MNIRSRSALSSWLRHIHYLLVTKLNEEKIAPDVDSTTKKDFLELTVSANSATGEDEYENHGDSVRVKDALADQV